MRTMLVAALLSVLAGMAGAQQTPDITLRARTVIDGKGQIMRNTVVTVRDGKIVHEEFFYHMG